jgi:hypothetical protein
MKKMAKYLEQTIIGDDRYNDNTLLEINTKRLTSNYSNKKPMSHVNLDALIPREDFVYQGENAGKSDLDDRLTVFHLLPKSKNLASIYHLLRKPDFQRETNEWDKYKIAELIECFIKRSFIPSVILWENQSSGHLFVIDGAHRLSALIAYINDDYGDGDISRLFYGHNVIPPTEIDFATKTRDYINSKIGSFNDLMGSNQQKADEMIKGAFRIQFISGNVDAAEYSFFKINQQGVVLSPTEQELCKNRDKASCIATRIIVRGAAGSQYWGGFSDVNQTKIKILAEELNKLLFTPPYNQEMRSVIRDHPLGGGTSHATPMIFEMMKLKNPDARVSDALRDLNGDETLEYLIWARKIVWQMLSEQSLSLGLFPSVYFYNAASVYIQSAFLGMALLLIEKRLDDSFLPKFIKVRPQLESFLVDYKVFLTKINSKYGSKERSFRHMKGYYLNLIEILSDNPGIDRKETLKLIQSKYSYLNERDTDTESPKAKDKFSKTAKIALTIKEELDGMPKCSICQGFYTQTRRILTILKTLNLMGTLIRQTCKLRILIAISLKICLGISEFIRIKNKHLYYS